MHTARTFLFLVIMVASTVLWGVTAIMVSVLAGRDDLAHVCGRLWSRWNLWASGVSVHVKGLENIDPEKAYIYASNHQGAFDILAIMGMVPVQFRWLAKEELFRIPLFGQAMAAIGYIPIDRSDRRKAFESLRQAARRVREGTSIVIFPEGTRSSDGVLQSFKKGGLILAIQSQQPVVPISISGSHRILPKSERFRIHPGPIFITIGTPIPTEGYSVKDRDALGARVREGIRRHLPPSEGGVLGDAPESMPAAS